MARGKKEIRKVNVNSGEYYVYDLPPDSLGKRKRVYGKSKQEVEAKIEEALKKRSEETLAYKPSSNLLSEYVLFYFKNSVGQVSARELRKLITLAERMIFKSEIDKNIDEISANEVQSFLDKAALKYPQESINDTADILLKTLRLASETGIDIFDLTTITVPKESTQPVEDYIMSPDDFEYMLDFCIKDNCNQYGYNEQIIIFCMLTGLKLSELKKIKSGDIAIDDRVVCVNERTVPLSERCVRWLIQQAEEGLLPLPTGGGEGDKGVVDSVISISRYTYNENCDENTLLFLNNNGTSPTAQSIQYTILHIAKRCALPKGITGKTLCKSYIVSELHKGTSAEKLKEWLGYKSAENINEIQDEYVVRKKLFW